MKTYSESDIKAAITDLLSENETQYGSRTDPLRCWLLQRLDRISL